MPGRKIEMFTDTEFEHCIPIDAYDDEIAAMVDGDEPLHELDGKSAVDIQYDYPLSGKFVLSIDHPTGKTEWTRRELFLAIKSGYERIYAEEEDADLTDEAGPYGIWGHDIGDLVVEMVHIKPNAPIKLSIGS